MVERPADESQEMVGIDRFLQVVVGARLHGADGVAYRPVGGHQDHRHLGVGALRRCQDLVTGGPRQAQVGEDHGVAVAPDLLHGGPSVRRLFDAEPFGLEGLLQDGAQALLVLHQEDPVGGLHRDGDSCAKRVSTEASSLLAVSISSSTLLISFSTWSRRSFTLSFLSFSLSSSV